jgi:hypothetical protein
MIASIIGAMWNEPGKLAPHAHAVRGRWTRSALVGAAFSFLIHVWVLSEGTWNLFRWGRQSDLYDAQARSLLDGTFAMDQRVLGIESFGRGDQHFMYFGPIPAVLRLPVVAATRHLDGRLAAASMLLALVVATAALLGLGWRIRCRVLTDRVGVAADETLAVSRFEAVSVAVTFFAILGGSSLLYASSRTWVYHEAIFWGMALTLASLCSLLAWLDVNPARAAATTSDKVTDVPDDLMDGHLTHRTHRHLVSASVLAMLALLTRPSVGGGALAVIGIVAGRELALQLIAAVRRRRERGSGDTSSPRSWDRIIYIGVVVMPVVAYSVVNWIKFRRLFGVPFDQQGFTLLNERRREMLAANGGTLFNVDFVPTNIFTYLRPDLIGFGQAFPYIYPVRPSTTIGSPFFDLIDLTAGVPTTMPLLLVLGAVGATATLRRTNPRVRALWPLLAGCALGTVPVLAIGYLANRYQSDFLPLLVIAALIGLPIAVHWLEIRADSLWLLGAAVTGLVLVGLGTTANLALGFSYQRALSPSLHPDSVASYIENQQRADDWFGDGRLADVSRVDALPTESRIGDIAIVGECDGLYFSDGVDSIDGSLTHWRLAELSVQAGRSSGTITLPSDAAPALPLVTLAPGATPIAVNVEVNSARESMVVVAASADGVTRGPDLPLRTGEALEWETFADPFVGRYEVYLDGRVAVFGELLGRSPAQVTNDTTTDTTTIDTTTIDTTTTTGDRDDGVQVCEALSAALGSDDGGQ